MDAITSLTLLITQLRTAPSEAIDQRIPFDVNARFGRNVRSFRGDTIDAETVKCLNLMRKRNVSICARLSSGNEKKAENLNANTSGLLN